MKINSQIAFSLLKYYLFNYGVEGFIFCLVGYIFPFDELYYSSNLFSECVNVKVFYDLLVTSCNKLVDPLGDLLLVLSILVNGAKAKDTESSLEIRIPEVGKI